MNQTSLVKVPSSFDIGLGSEGQVKWDPIKFDSSNMIELSNDINEATWIDHNSSLTFDYFTTNDDSLEYLGT